MNKMMFIIALLILVLAFMGCNKGNKDGNASGQTENGSNSVDESGNSTSTNLIDVYLDGLEQVIKSYEDADRSGKTISSLTFNGAAVKAFEIEEKDAELGITARGTDKQKIRLMNLKTRLEVVNGKISQKYEEELNQKIENL